MPRRSPVKESAPVEAEPRKVVELAPVVAHEPDGFDLRADDADAHEPAPVFPTEADEAAAIATVLADDPHLSAHHLARAVRAQLAADGPRAARRREAALADAIAEAPMFPTELHAVDLRERIPSISDDELRAVLHAGYAAYLASVDAGEPVTDVPTEEQ